MKRCIICGNVGDDNSTVCEVCGNPYVDMEEGASGEGILQEQPGTDFAETSEPEIPQTQENGAEAAQVNETETAEAEASRPVRHPQNAAGAHPTRRMRGGPQIYGQEGSAPGMEYGRQGAIRRNVQGRRPAQSAGRPMQGGQNMASGRPAQGGQNVTSGRPAQGTQNMAPPRPAQGGQNAASGRPAQMNGQAPAMQTAGQQGRPGSRPANPGQTGRPMGQGAADMGYAQSRPVQAAGRAPQSYGHKASQIMEASRDMMRSPLFLLIAILYTAHLVGAIAAIFMEQMNYSQAVRLLKSMALPSQLSGYAQTVISLLSQLDSGAVAANLVLHLPNLLFCIGLWLIFATAMTAKENMSGVGFVFTRITIIFNMVISCIVMAATLVVTVAIVIASWASGTVSMMVLSAIALVAVIAVVMMVIMYYFCYLATLKTCRLNGDEGESYGRVSGYVAVIHILLALVSVINLLSGIVNGEIANIIGGAGSIGWMLLFAVWLFMYRGKLEEIEG